MLTEHREPVGHIEQGNDRRVIPEIFDQVAGLVDPSLLPQKDQEQVPQGGDLQARVVPGPFAGLAPPR